MGIGEKTTYWSFRGMEPALLLRRIGEVQLAFLLLGRMHRLASQDAGEKELVMKARGKSDEVAKARYAELKAILEERRREILNEVQVKMRDVRAEGAAGEGQGVLDAAEASEADIQDDIEFALIQMKSETLHKINEALGRLEEGTFGYCFECGDEISERRLRALPFAVRCKDCEEAREIAEQRERQQTSRRSSGFLLDLN
jgi:DnaK suppressor protein